MNVYMCFSTPRESVAVIRSLKLVMMKSQRTTDLKSSMRKKKKKKLIQTRAEAVFLALRYKLISLSQSIVLEVSHKHFSHISKLELIIFVLKLPCLQHVL